ncbi:ATP-binding protein [Vibrio parahaemolyticus]|uniref:ATP-binding protein n=1 Tax=Vibrio parahaemolyticus TaxID=670 RepID=UPI0015DFF9B3|nr:ATP-binding protein [Vibrio parahaemolyticus]HCG9710658.1 ATP-binding protein [Vibrio parahaemolyticus]HCH1148763.1 ATP-binding protein [Vibrio parahaemolyticus]
MNKSETKSSKLLGIVLFHSFIPRKLFKVKAIGHSNNTGDNGAGKSTLLSLLPAFYGADPSKLVDRQADKVSFVDYYLPTPKSVIVFEYEKLGERKCSVMYRNGSSVAYRFLTGTAEQLFSQHLYDELIKQGSETRTWLKNLVSQSMSVSSQIETSVDYRSVILNNKKRLAQRRSTGKNLVAIAHEYSLCSASHNMNHIDILTATMMRHKKMLSRFKTMIVDCFLNNTSMDDVPYKKEYSELINSLDVFVQLETKKSKFDEALANKDSLEEYIKQLNSYRAQIASYLHQLALSDTQLSDKIRSQKEQHEILVNERKGKLHTFNSELNNQRIEFERKSKIIDAIYNKRDKYENEDDILGKITLYNSLSDMLREVESARKHYDNLLEDVRTEETELKSQVQKLELECSDFRSSKQKEINNILNTKEEIFEQKNDRLEAMQSDLNLQKKKLQDEFDEQSDKIRQEQFRLAILEGQSLEFTPEQKGELRSLESDLESKREQLNASHNAVIHLNEQLRQAEKNHENSLSTYHTCTSELKEISDEIVSVSRALLPAKGSLNEYLDQKVPDWRGNIGKVISPSLLNAKNLKPFFDPEATESIFGLYLDLDSIALPDFCLSEEKLSERLETLKIKESEVEVRQGKAKSRAKSDEQEADKLHKEIKIQSQRTKVFEEELSKLNLLKEQKTVQFESDAESRTSEVQKQKSVLESELFTIKSELKEKLENEEQRHQQERVQVKANFDYRLSEEDAKKSAIDELIKNKEKITSDRVSDYKLAFNQALMSKGVDPVSIERAKSKWESLERQCEEIKTFQALIHDYDTWLESEWKYIDSYNSEILVLDRQIKGGEAKRDDYEKSVNKRIDEILSSIKLDEDDLITVKEAIAQLTTCTNSLEKAVDESDLANVEDVSVDSEFHSVEHAVSLVTDKITAINTLKKEIVSKVKDVSNTILGLDDNNEIKMMWEQMRSATMTKLSENYDYAINYDSPQFSLACLGDLEELVLNVIPDVRDVKIETLRSISTQISNYHQTLKQVNSKVDSVSSTLDKSIETGNPFPAIDSIHIKLSSKIHTFDLWKDLNLFSVELDRWSGETSRGLPSKAFLASFKQLLSSFKEAQISKNLESLVEMEITIVENGRPAVVRNDEDLEKVGSEGISKLAIIVVFCGMTRFLCQDEDVAIHWPLDELGKISISNLAILFDMMAQKGICLFTAQPDLHPATYKYFATKNHIVKNVGVKSFIGGRRSRVNPLLSESKQNQSTEVVE